ncbi:MAG TPA: MarR family transcriptional regulator [Solirubrobacteraceae bacterium]|nr:MarR family transcriptional regulator [Solirubrobacteraceae bacterium]
MTSARTANLLGAHALVVADRMRLAAGMELSSAAVLSALETFADGASIDQLRRVLGLSHSGGVRIVTRLASQGLVAREADPADRRAVRLHLTAEGRRAARRVLAARKETLAGLLAPLGTRETADLERLLERLLAAVTDDREAANRICRLCDPDVCGHPDRCPVTQAALAL